MLGPHVLNPTDAALAWSRRAGIVKAVDDTRALREAPAGALKIFRHYFPNQDINRRGGDVAAEVIAALGDAPATHIELFNEVGAGVGHGLERYVDMTHEAFDYCFHYRPDLTVIGYSFSTGTPEPIDWAYLRTRQFGGVSVVAMHEYYGDIGFDQWQALRHRWLWKSGDPKIAITECGRDAVEGGRGGWMKDGIAAEAYAAELLAYDREIAKDAYVIGATPFSSGPTLDWQNFTMDPISPLLPSPPPGGPPVTADFTSPNHGGPRAQTLGVVIHATLSGKPITIDEEYNATIGWFENPASQVSAHAVVGPTGQVHRSVRPGLIAWHCRGSNATHLGIEMAKVNIGDPIEPATLDRAAQIVAGWLSDYRIPAVWSVSAGIEEHRNMPTNIDGHSDVGGPFDRTDFMARVKSYVTQGVTLTDAQRQAILDDLDFLWAYSKATETTKDPAASEKIIHERIVALKVTLGLQ